MRRSHPRRTFARRAVLGAALGGTLPVPRSTAQQRTPGDFPSFNQYILNAVTEVHGRWAGGGYDRRRAFTRDLQYGPMGIIQASRPLLREPGPNPTMCVAAVAEVVVEAINMYARETGDASVYEKLPASSWSRGSRLAIRANLFMFEGTGSRGSAHAMQMFGIGREKMFSDLRPGDFVNFNRTGGSGHAVVFLSFLSAQGEEAAYGAETIGFRYFSAQGMGRPDGGLGYRNAYFTGHAPSPRGRDDDRNVIKGFRHDADGRPVQRQVLLNSGEMLHPTAWRTAEALVELRRVATRDLEDEARTRGLSADDLVERDLRQDFDLYDDGSEE